MLHSTITKILITLLAINIFPDHFHTIYTQNKSNILNRSVNTSDISVSIVDDDVTSGSTISATISAVNTISSLFVSSASDDVFAYLYENEDGSYTSNFYTNGNPGEHFLTYSTTETLNLSVDSNSTEITSFYIYSDGNNDCISYCSMEEAKSKFFINHVATNDELILLEKEDMPEGYSLSITKYEAETHYAAFVYGTNDITTNYQISTGNFANNIRIEGNVTWVDENNVSHPLKNNLVVLWDDDFFWDEYCDSAYTNNNGHFSFEINNQSFLEWGGRDLFVSLYTISNSVSVQSFWWGNYIYCTPKFQSIQNNSKIEYNIEIKPGISDRASAFEICQAEEIPYNYINNLANTNLPCLTVFYPAFNGDGCYYNNVLNYIAVGQKYYKDWDCLNHEYGHFVNNVLNLCDTNVGGTHYVGEDLIFTRGKDEGLKLALSEGLASYLGIAAQIYYANEYINYPRVGDEVYNSESGVNENYGLYRYGHSTNITGEGNEFSVTSLLIKLLDNVPRNNDNVDLGHAKMWTAISAYCHNYLSELVSTILLQNEQHRSDIGKLLELEGFSPELNNSQNTILSLESSNSCWTFSWLNNSGFASSRPNNFKITFENILGQTYCIENISSTSITLNDTQKNSVLSLCESDLKWYVTSYNTNSPLTGGYVSDDGYRLKPNSTILSLDTLQSSILESGSTQWFKFTAPRDGTYHFESLSNLDLYGELFPNLVINNTSLNRISYNDDSGENLNFKIDISLTKDQIIYLRVRGYNYNSNIYGNFNILLTVDHEHEYTDHYEIYTDEKHKAYCSCGDYILKPHVIQSGNNMNSLGHNFAICIKCGALIDLDSTIVIVTEINDPLLTDNQSYILSNGIIVIVPEDLNECLLGES